MLNPARPRTAMQQRTPRGASVLIDMLETQFAVVFTSLIFAWTIYQAHATILGPVWGYLGFSFIRPTLAGYCLMVGLVTVGSAAMPTKIDRPSSMIVMFMHVTLFVPCVTISLALRADSLESFGPMLVVYTLVHALAGLVSRSGPAPPKEERFVPAPEATVVLIGVWAAATVLIIAVFGEIMRFASLTEVYDQRFAIDRSVNIVGYVRSYYINLVIPALIAIGLLRRNVLVLGIGLVGCVVSYMVDAQKTALALPVLMILVYLVFRYAERVAQLFVVPILLLSFLTLLAVVLRDTQIGFLLHALLVVRGIAIPALTLVQYQELFATYGHTWWSNITGLSLIIPAPAAFANDPSWPAIGQIVGDHYFGAGTNLNANANPYAGEGLAAGGLIGLAVIGIVMAVFLRIFDLCVRGWDRTFVLLVSVPIALALGNAHLSTVLVSFGLGAWLLVFNFYKPKGS